ncbi:unnamed protein product [Prorocentrum cordatum]|uniref:Calmodulin n=1 Tax=Prorocentrum cordatum TaxID=2364126 RepID=A0ABN9PNN3_9DINO|nr:unnamed protein product [Polarella glacialis]
MARLGQASSLPALTQGSFFGASRSGRAAKAGGRPRSSPLRAAQTLCTVSVGERRVRREEVKGRALRFVSDGRLGFVAPEHPGAGAHPRRAPAGERLPPLADVLGEMGLAMPCPQREDRGARRQGSSFQPYRQGPRLPVRRARAQEAAAAAEVEAGPEEGASRRSSAQGPEEEEVLESAKNSARLASSSPRRSSGRAFPRQVARASAGLRRPSRDGSRRPSRERAGPGGSPSLQRTDSPSSASGDGLGKSCDKGQVALPWSDDAIRSAFSQFDDDRDGEVHKENLPAMLKHLGCRPGASDTEQLAQQQTQYSTVSYEEFVDFLRQYHELDCSKLRELFLGADVNKDGSMDLPELHALLNRLGFALSQQATVEALQELDHDMNTVLSFSEFIGLRDYLQQNEGMTKADVEELRELFEKVKENTTSGANTIKECWRICNYLGYPIAEHEFSQIVRTTDLDCDLSEGMAWGDLLKIIRRIRERERSSLSALASKHGADNQTFPISELSTVLADFGYMVSEEAIFECLDKFDEVEEEDTLTVDELAIFLREYRKVEGFTNAEIEEFERAFMEQSQADAAGMEGLDTLATGRVLRWFGIATTLQQVQTLLEQLDFDGSGRLEFNEFVKLMRRIHQEQATRVRRLFDQLTMQEAAPYIAIDALPNAVALFEGAPADLGGSFADPLLVAGAMEKAGLRDAVVRGKARGAMFVIWVGADLESTRRIVSPLMKRREADSSPCAASAVEVAQDGGKPLPAVKRQTLTVGQLPLFAEDNSPSSSPSNAASKQQREKTPRGYASRRGFQEFFRQWNKVAVDTVRQRAGYGALEVAKLRAAFNQFDKDGNGTIESTEFRDLIANYFPDATKSRQGPTISVKGSVFEDVQKTWGTIKNIFCKNSKFFTNSLIPMKRRLQISRVAAKPGYDQTSGP